MSEPTTIRIDDIEYVRKDSLTTDRPDHTGSPVRIVVLHRGWVVIGRYSEHGNKVHVDDASTIRVWGTTKGLGELCAGPTVKTVLDPCGHVEALDAAVVLTLNCEEAAWQARL